MTSVLGSGRASGGPSGQLRCKSKRRRRRRSKRKGKRDVIFLLFCFPALSACHLHNPGCSRLYCQRSPAPALRCPDGRGGPGGAGLGVSRGRQRPPRPRGRAQLASVPAFCRPEAEPTGVRRGVRQAPSGAVHGWCGGAVPGPRPAPPGAVPAAARSPPEPAGSRCRCPGGARRGGCRALQTTASLLF